MCESYLLVLGESDDHVEPLVGEFLQRRAHLLAVKEHHLVAEEAAVDRAVDIVV